MGGILAPASQRQDDRIPLSKPPSAREPVRYPCSRVAAPGRQDSAFEAAISKGTSAVALLQRCSARTAGFRVRSRHQKGYQCGSFALQNLRTDMAGLATDH